MPNDIGLTVLVIDDDDVTAESLERALRRTETQFRIVTAADGQEGLDILHGLTATSVCRPYLVLLDLNMPGMGGFEFLENLRNDPKLRDSVVFVLSTSEADADRTRAYSEHIAGYLLKSAIGPRLDGLAALLNEYGKAVRLPA